MLWNALLLAVRAIRRNVLRSSLTILGIVIGVAAVIIMVTLGAGASASLTQQITSLGSNLLMIQPGQQAGRGQARSSAPPFVLADAQAIATAIPAVAVVAPSSSRSGRAIFGNENWTTIITGVTNEYFAVRNLSVASGRQFTEGELRAGSAVCVLGTTVKETLFGAQDAVGAKIRLEDFSCQIVGVLEAKGQTTLGGNQDDVALIPLRTLQRRVAGNQDVGVIQVSVRDDQPTETIQADIRSILRARRHLSGTRDDDFQITDMKEISGLLAGTTQLLTALLGAVAAVSLLVGGIGIMNIMLVSVTERTREIGIRLAIGAMEREVLTQFLVEAVALSSFGGVIGIVLALIVSFLVANAMTVPFIVDPTIVFVAFFFSAAVGMIFGYFPARRAAQLDPIEALRHE